MYWAQELANQNDDAELKAQFSTIAKNLESNEEVIVNELNGVQRQSVDLKGYFNPDDAICSSVMRPSTTLNSIIDNM